MSTTKPLNTLNIRLSTKFAPPSKAEVQYMSHILYGSAFRSLMYAMVCIRPNIAHAVNVVNKFIGQGQLGKEH